MPESHLSIEQKLPVSGPALYGELDPSFKLNTYAA